MRVKRARQILWAMAPKIGSLTRRESQKKRPDLVLMISGSVVDNFTYTDESVVAEDCSAWDNAVKKALEKAQDKDSPFSLTAWVRKKGFESQ